MLKNATQFVTISYEGRQIMTQNIHIRVSEKKKQEIKNNAEKEGLSVTAFILASVNDRINKSIKEEN